MPVKDLLLLGNPRLYLKSDPVTEDELEVARSVAADLHDTLMAFRSSTGAARAVAAPQIGVFKRIIYMHISEPSVFINPELSRFSEETFDMWDDCMSFPELLVRVRRHRECTIRWRDQDWVLHERRLKDLSELLQHEVDHLDGILATDRAVGSRSIVLKSQRAFVEGPVANQ